MMRAWPKFNLKGNMFLLLALGLIAVLAPDTAHSSTEAESAFLSSVSISILAATVCAYAATLVKQPLILSYIAAGMIIGPDLEILHFRGEVGPYIDPSPGSRFR